MRKTYCDACGNEVKGQRYQFTSLVHIQDDGRYSGAGYVTTSGEDGGWLYTSGREESKDLCLKCYNKIYGVAWDEFKRISRGEI